MGSVNDILQANNRHRVASAQYRAAEAQTRNRNALEAAGSNFSNFMRSLGNRQRVEAASKEYNYQVESLSEEIRAGSGQSLNLQLQRSFALGALNAQAGYVGVGGSSVDLMDTFTRMQSEMDQEAHDNAMELMASRGAQRTAQIMSNAYGSVDMSQTFGSFDYTQHIEPKAMSNRWAKLAGVAVATYFGGPMAGDAVASAFVGEWQAANGDFDGMSASFQNAISGGLRAYQGWSQRGGQSWASAFRQGSEPVANWFGGD